jgi:hypothetical protein
VRVSGKSTGIAAALFTKIESTIISTTCCSEYPDARSAGSGAPPPDLADFMAAGEPSVYVGSAAWTAF